MATVAEYELEIGAHVNSKDGTRLGSIQKLIVHPDTNQVDGFLLGKGHFSTNKIVAVGQIESAHADGVVLKLTTRQAEQLPAFIQEQMLRAPGNLTYQGRWGAQADFAGSGENWVMRAPGGDFSTIDSNSLFSPAPIGTLEAQNLDDLPPDSVLLNKGTEVIGSDGKKVGHVDEIIIDSERGITGFLVKAGHVFTHDVHVPMSSVAGISHVHVRLNVTAEEAARASHAASD
jgi:uncharacterized protein YrrD